MNEAARSCHRSSTQLSPKQHAGVNEAARSHPKQHAVGSRSGTLEEAGRRTKQHAARSSMHSSTKQHAGRKQAARRTERSSTHSSAGKLHDLREAKLQPVLRLFHHRSCVATGKAVKHSASCVHAATSVAVRARARIGKAEAARITKQHVDEAACTNGVKSSKHSRNRKLFRFATKHAGSAFGVRARACTKRAAPSKQHAVCRSSTHYLRPHRRDPGLRDKKKALIVLGSAGAAQMWAGCRNPQGRSLTRLLGRKQRKPL